MKKTAAYLVIVIAVIQLLLGMMPSSLDFLSGRASFAHASTVFPGSNWDTMPPVDMGFESNDLSTVADVAGGHGMIVKEGYLVYSWGDISTQIDIKSSTKSIGSMALMLALQDGNLALTDTLASFNHPWYGEISGPAAAAKDQIKIWHLATHTAGFDRPGGSKEMLAAPATEWLYSDSGPNWLSEVIDQTYPDDTIVDLLNDSIFVPIGIAGDQISWRQPRYSRLSYEFGSGITTSPDSLARIGLLLENGGNWDGQQLIDSAIVEQVTGRYPGVASLATDSDDAENYGLLWWTNEADNMPKEFDGQGDLVALPADAFWSRGLGDSIMMVIPSYDMIITRLGTSWDGDDHYRRIYDNLVFPILSQFDDATPRIYSTPVTQAVVNHPYRYQVDAAGVPTPTYSLTTSPTGMTIDAVTGLVKWTPASTGAYTVTVEASNTEGMDSQTYTLDVIPPFAPTITSTPVTTAAKSQLYTYDVEATGGPPPTYTLSTAPAGMSIDSASGLINWTPTANGTFDVSLGAGNSEGIDSQSFSINVTYFLNQRSIYLPVIGAGKISSEPSGMGPG